jgi:hypothetical protein
MSNFAELSENNIVIRVVSGDNASPNQGYDDIVENLGGRWVQTSYNGSFRKNFAMADYCYDEDRDAFIPPKPYESWILNEDTCRWQAPIPYPEDGKIYQWYESTLSWVN